MRGKIGVLLLALVLVVSGCRMQKDQDMGEGSSSNGGMGRYEETFYEMPKEINRNGGITWQKDGSVSVISFGEGLFRSDDEGKTWKKEETIWFPMIEEVYCLAAVMGPDGTVAASCSGKMPEAAREACKKEVPEDWEGNYCIFGMPDGSVKVVDFGFRQEDGTCISTLMFKEDGRLFAGDFQGKIYEVDAEKESLRELFTAERGAGYMDFSGEILMAVGYDRLYRYDLQEGVLMPQEEIVDAYIRQELADGTVSYTSGGFPLAVAGGEKEDVIYIAGKDGMYRHVIGGSTIEQVIDGGLSTLGDSQSCIYRMKVLAGQEFLIVYQPSIGLVRYSFNEQIPSRPDRELWIYSLQENPSVRQAVTSFKKEHTDIYIRYEVGMEYDGSMTREDAIKKLNTQVLAGEGPDVLLLDGLPLDAYTEKGMLRDLRPVLASLGEEELFSNIVGGFTAKDGAVYALPMCIRVPLLVGDRESIGRMDSLSGAAEEAERFRVTNPEGGIFGIYDAETMLRLFGMVSSEAWVREDGQMDSDKITEFLEQVKRIYDAELSGAVTEQKARLEEEAEEMVSYGIDAAKLQLEACHNVLNIPRGYAGTAGGYVESIQLCLDSVTSILRVDETLDYRIFSGQTEDPFLPKALVGISAVTKQPEDAEEFVRMMFGADTQKDIYEGFPVNRKAYEARFGVAEENDSNGSMMLLLDNETEQELNLYWPNQAERQKFTAFVEQLKTPVMTEDTLCELVYETGSKVLKGEQSVEEGTAEIVKKATIYLAE